MKSVKFTVLLVLCQLAWSQTITWTKVYTGPLSGTIGNFYNGYHDIHYDAYSDKVYLDSTSLPSGTNAIYSMRLSQFNPADNSMTLVASNGQSSAVAGCTTSLQATNGADTYHSTYHAVGQIFLDGTLHRLISVGGVAGTFNWPSTFYNVLSPSGAAANWTLVNPAIAPAFPAGTTVSTTLSASVGNNAMTDVTISLSSLSTIYNGSILSLDDGNGSQEYVRVTSGGGQPCVGGSSASNPLTVTRAYWGSTAKSHSMSAPVRDRWSPSNSGVIVHDPLDNVYVFLGQPSAGAQFMWVYCDTNGSGMTTMLQSAAGCSSPDTWISITANVNCSDNACIPTGGAGKGVPTGSNYPNMVWDAADQQIIKFGGMVGATTIVNQLWFYKVSTQTWTPRVAGLAKNTDTFTTVDCTTAGSAITPSNGGKYACTPSVNTTLNVRAGSVSGDIISVKLCQGASLKTVTWTGVTNPPYTPTGVSGGVNCTLVSYRWDGAAWNNINPPNMSSNTEGGRIAYAWDSSVNVYRYHLTARSPLSSGIPPTTDPQDWYYSPSTDTWTHLNVGSCSTTTQTCGPYLSETMTFDSSRNQLLAWSGYLDGSGNYQAGYGTMWAGTLFTPVRVQQTGTATIQGVASH